MELWLANERFAEVGMLVPFTAISMPSSSTHPKQKPILSWLTSYRNAKREKWKSSWIRTIKTYNDLFSGDSAFILKQQPPLFYQKRANYCTKSKIWWITGLITIGNWDMQIVQILLLDSLPTYYN
jgi:hypothetical protein